LHNLSIKVTDVGVVAIDRWIFRDIADMWRAIALDEVEGKGSAGKRASVSGAFSSGRLLTSTRLLKDV